MNAFTTPSNKIRRAHPFQTILCQQCRFDQFRQEYNQVRPHEALDQETPASRYRPSKRAYPRHIPQIEYPGHFEVRRVSRNGASTGTSWVNVSTVLMEEYIGLEEVDDVIWSVLFGPVY